jgi:hypothetical protein
MDHGYVCALYGEPPAISCPFTGPEIVELEATQELLVYVPKGITPAEMCRRWQISSNVDFERDRLVRSVMTDESHWFIASASPTPEHIYKSALAARRSYEDEGLHGMDLRRYLAFVATFRLRFDRLPDQAYWTFLLAGSYDRSGVSLVGFDTHGVLSHHGWMRNFKAKFAGSRYAVLAPRIEITRDTENIPRAYRGGGRAGREADMDD